jgi:hypothetical protein
VLGYGQDARCRSLWGRRGRMVARHVRAP